MCPFLWMRLGLLAIALPAGVSHVLANSELRVYPQVVDLTGSRDYQRVVVQQVLPSGETRDVTARCAIEPKDAAIAASEGNVILPLSDGETALGLRFESYEFELPVRVQGATDDPTLSLRRDVMPIFMKAGCNSGRCHGAARGQEGFRLSLFGFDPAGDHFNLTRELPGRRIDLGSPKQSLLLTKALGESPHGGGERFTDDSKSYAILRRWIEEGTEDDAAGTPQPVGIAVLPTEAVLVGEEAAQQLVVVATYDDGSTRDVTDWAVYLSNNDNAAEVSETGKLVAANRGEAFVMARFATFTEGVPVIVLPSDVSASPEMPEPHGEVDLAVHKKLRKLRIAPSAICDDEEFLRRVYLDLTGLTPTVDERERFLASASPTRRSDLIDELLETEAFTDVWTMRLGELFKIRTSNQVSYKALLGFHNWVREQVAENQPLDRLFADVLSSSGGTFDTPPTNYFQMEANTIQIAENVAQSYVGMRIQCAQCHNHPFDRWTVDDYYGFASFFSQVSFKQSTDPREFIVYDSGKGELDHIVTGEPAEPTYLGGGKADLSDRNRREALAAWIVSNENRAFARNVANIVWSHHFGRGVVEPVDDVRISNPPSNGPLLELLTDVLIDCGYDLRELVSTICNSRTYQLSTRANPTNENDLAYFSRAQVRRLRAETLLDSISQVTETSNRFPRLPAGARAVQIADGAASNYFLTTFGRAPRETVCACEVDMEPNLSQTFHLLNGETTNKKVSEGGVVRRLLDDGADVAVVIEHLYLRCYSRRPTPSEGGQLLDSVDPDDIEGSLNDIFWALLNSKEFIFNH
ncbi:MAG: DUF1549 domain-containing protein [Planctomycetota bacterium]